jgi:hypothetical protein
MTARAVVGAVVVAGLALLASSAPATAAASSGSVSGLSDKDVVVVCFETVDGKAGAGCAIGPSLSRMLRESGARSVDATQAARVRAQMSGDKLASGDMMGIDFLDA